MPDPLEVRVRRREVTGKKGIVGKKGVARTYNADRTTARQGVESSGESTCGRERKELDAVVREAQERG